VNDSYVTMDQLAPMSSKCSKMPMTVAQMVGMNKI